MKNLLIQWDIEAENRKILSMFDEKPPNLVKNQGKKLNNQFNKKPLN